MSELPEAQIIEPEAKRTMVILPYSFSRDYGVCLDKETLFFKEKISFLALSELQRVLDFKPAIKIINETDFSKLLQTQNESNASGAMRDIDGMEEVMDLNAVAQQLSEPEDILELDNDAPIIKLLNALLAEAIRKQASDIHIEQYESRLRIRFRIDGRLQEILEPDVKIAPMIISRIKVMAKLDIAEKRLPQDGRISIKVGGRSIDVRISTIPTGSGLEKVVMRILNKEAGNLDINYLGLPPNMKKSVMEIVNKPHGILLVTGPTGSGKTTTLYAILSRLNNKERNIMTIEDPVEYYLDGINQSQVNSKIGMTFVGSLRSILRQDPDVIMIGEIRDSETAKIAIQASLTGHLVFSTLHTNTSYGAITRLQHMEVEPFLLASSLNGVLAQRLVRTLCDCKIKKTSNSVEMKLLGIDTAVQIFEFNGCEECNHSGYKGRTGVYDLLTVDDTVKAMIHRNASEQEIKQYVRKSSKGMVQMGIDLVLSGQTSLSEVIQIIGSLEED